jgi:hypothetical protein
MYMRTCICMNAYSTDFLPNEKSEMRDENLFIGRLIQPRVISENQD